MYRKYKITIKNIHNYSSYKLISKTCLFAWSTGVFFHFGLSEKKNILFKYRVFSKRWPHFFLNILKINPPTNS